MVTGERERGPETTLHMTIYNRTVSIDLADVLIKINR